MLAEMIVEEEFELKDEEPWYDKQDLERDLHLAAELGKTLLDRNRELEQGLQQLYSTNQEQLLEIEYLTRQVDLLRQMNDQQARAYEQLDLSARDQEHANRRLQQDGRSAQHRISSLTETIEGLQGRLEELQTEVEALKEAQEEQRGRRELAEQRRSLGAQSVCCLRELYDLEHQKYQAYESLRVDRPWTPQRSYFHDRDRDRDRDRDPEEEHSSLQRAVQHLQGQLAAERGRREAAEQEAGLAAAENGALERRLAGLEGGRLRQTELEAEVEELRQLWREDYYHTSASRRPVQTLLPDTLFFPPEEKPGSGQGQGQGQEEEEEGEKEAQGEAREEGRRVLQRCSSDGGLREEEIRRGHDLTCIRRSDAVKQRGISLLNEVDAQYSALQVKYEELLRRCQQEADGLSHKAVQTPHSPRVHPSPQAQTPRPPPSPGGAPSAPPHPPPEDGVAQPEYKVLFREIFTCIQKTKEDLSENRTTPPNQGGL